MNLTCAYIPGRDPSRFSTCTSVQHSSGGALEYVSAANYLSDVFSARVFLDRYDGCLIVLNVEGFGLWRINPDAECCTLRDTEERLVGRGASWATNPLFAGNLDIVTLDYYSPHFGRMSTIAGPTKQVAARNSIRLAFFEITSRRFFSCTAWAG